MRLSFPSVAILSLFAASSHAFAPPRSTTSSIISRRLAAGNELSGMLSEYSTSATTKAADIAAEKVADVVSSAVTTPISTPPPAEVTESGMDSLMKAAGAAQDAANQATAAAAAVATKGAAATKAAAAAGVSVAGGIQLKPLVGGVLVPAAKLPFQVDPSKMNSDSAFDASARAQENLAILKANLLGGFGGSTGDVDTAAPYLDLKSLLKLDSVKFDSASITPAVSDIIASLHLKEYGGWYAAAAMAIYASQQRTAGMEDANVQFESELAVAREKASEAASAAGLAAEGAKLAKKLAMKMEKDMKKDGGEALLESSRSKMVQIEKDIMKNQMRALEAEVSSLRSQVASSEGGTKKKAATKTKAVKTEIEEMYPTKVVMKSDPDEDARLIELLKAMDEDGQIQQKKAAEELEKKREDESKFVAKEKKKAEQEAKSVAKEEAKLVAKEKKKVAEEAKSVAKEKKKAEEETKIVAKEKKKAEDESKSVAKEKKKAEEETKVVAKGKKKAGEEAKLVAKEKKKAEEEAKFVAEEKEQAEEEAKFLAKFLEKAERRNMTKGVEAAQAKAEVAKKATKKTAKKASTKAKTVAKSTTATEKSPVVKKASTTAAPVDDWASLAESTLKRKTVAQLTEYLTGKGVLSTDGSGKSLKKAELLEAVKSL
eukprot:CAMPEP_0201869562 /NCGR_PEP_ID=MMETSP0902-20130614/3030_1 /ASSEMBLY_ACC=CAM_ASM_000551 /TAXON_ID=420261 /ORGANISM="Thalassiosira antarctica, Strain CCMP982" /LENGTH=657 /DNA_ID=CAMNT_0048395089 /DNA_START=34 /DNA_END=2007 /DNA_ORIENTATION=-